MEITVVALGKIGLPLAVQFAEMGHRVHGADVNGETVSLVNGGEEPFPGEEGLADKLATVVGDGRLTATTDTTTAVSQSRAVVIVVPLFVDDEGVPDFEWMDSATADVARGLQPGTLVSYETTLPVGTTRSRFWPMLAQGSELSPSDFNLVFSPERVFTGRVFADLRKYPKLVGGVSEEATNAGLAFYQSVLTFDERPELPKPNGVWDMGTAEAAEMAKLAETTYRDVNIGLANQFARFADSQGFDIQRVIEACNSQPFSHIHQPGIAVGGHCIPIYPRFYLWNDPSATVVAAARAANAGMPQYAVDTLTRLHGSLTGQRVAVMGAAYRGGVKETAFSGVFPTVAALQDAGAEVYVDDPLYTAEELAELGFTAYGRGQAIDAAVIQTDHAEYAELSSGQLPARTIVDGRGILTTKNFPQAVVATLGSLSN